jgi:hypothetical protein
MEPQDDDASDLLLECFMNWAEVLKNIDKKR